MSREKLGKVKKTIGFPPELIEGIKEEARILGVGWTTMVPILVQKAIDQNKADRK